MSINIFSKFITEKTYKTQEVKELYLLLPPI